MRVGLSRLDRSPGASWPRFWRPQGWPGPLVGGQPAGHGDPERVGPRWGWRTAGAGPWLTAWPRFWLRGPTRVAAATSSRPLPASGRSAGVEQLMYIKEDLIIPHVRLGSSSEAPGGGGQRGVRGLWSVWGLLERGPRPSPGHWLKPVGPVGRWAGAAETDVSSIAETDVSRPPLLAPQLLRLHCHQGTREER